LIGSSLAPRLEQYFELRALARSLRSSNPDARELAARRLVRIGKPSVPVLRAALDDRRADVSALAAGQLLSAGAEADLTIPAFLAALTDIRVRLRRVAAQELGATVGVYGPRLDGSRRREVRNALRRALRDDDRFVRWAAIDSLLAFGPPEAAVREALESLLDEGDSQLRLAAARLLLRIDPSAARHVVTVLLRLVEDPIPGPLNSQALELVQEHEPGSVKLAVPALIALAQAGDRFRKLQAIGLLGSMGAAAWEALPLLVELSENPRRIHPAHVRLAATYARVGVDPSQAPRALAVFIDLVRDPSLHPYQRERTIDQLRRMQPGAEANCMPTLIAQLKDGDWEHRLVAIRLLTYLGPMARPAIPVIEAIAQDGDIQSSAEAKIALHAIVARGWYSGRSSP
jgi:HEAT repeat protein